MYKLTRHTSRKIQVSCVFPTHNIATDNTDATFKDFTFPDLGHYIFVSVSCSVRDGPNLQLLSKLEIDYLKMLLNIENDLSEDKRLLTFLGKHVAEPILPSLPRRAFGARNIFRTYFVPWKRGVGGGGVTPWGNTQTAVFGTYVAQKVEFHLHLILFIHSRPA